MNLTIRKKLYVAPYKVIKQPNNKIIIGKNFYSVNIISCIDNFNDKLLIASSSVNIKSFGNFDNIGYIKNII